MSQAVTGQSTAARRSVVTAARIAVALLLILPAACSRLVTRPPDLAGRDVEVSRSSHEAFEARVTRLRGLHGWQMSGRLAFASPQDSGSGRIEWIQQSAALSVRLSAPVSRQSWQLVVDHEGARLLGLEQGTQYAASVDQLLESQFGFALSLAALADWLRGIPADGGVDDLRLDAQGRPVSFSQNGWQISYPDWHSLHPVDLPRRLFAERLTQEGSDRVRIVVDRWIAEADSKSAPASH